MLGGRVKAGSMVVWTLRNGSEVICTVVYTRDNRVYRLTVEDGNGQRHNIGRHSLKRYRDR